MSAANTQIQNPMARVMGLRNFRLLFGGTATSLLGDQFALIATPWLVLMLTGDPMALGLVLALAGIPRAVFMLVGGAVTDRISPRRVMLIADLVRLALTGWMAFAVFTGVVEVWMLYVFSLGFGLVAGFAIPAENSIVPMLVKDDDLQAGNSIIMGVSQLIGFVGPTLAGVLIGVYSSSSLGVGLAFGFDALSFIVSAACLWGIHLAREGEPGSTPEQAAETQESVWTAILAGTRYLWNDATMRMMFVVMMAVNFFLMGPLLVGIPVLADQRLAEGALAYGILMSAFAGGSLVGYLAAGALPRPKALLMRVILILALTVFGLVVGALGFIPSTWLDFVLLLLFGLGDGYISIIIFTWMQTRTPKNMLGRVMSIFMFANSGLTPVSQAIAGAVIKANLNLLFLGGGTMVLLVTVWAAFQPELRIFCENLTAAAPAE